MKSSIPIRISRLHFFTAPHKNLFVSNLREKSSVKSSRKRSFTNSLPGISFARGSRCPRLCSLFLAFTLTVTASTVSTGCAFPNKSGNTIAAPTESATSFDSFLDDFFRSEVTGNTINLHFTLSDPGNYGITEAPITLGNISQEAISESFAKTENTLALLEKYDYEGLSKEQQLTYDVLSDYLHTQLRTTDLSLYEEILKPSTGIQAQLPVLYEEYKFNNKADVDNYLALIALTGDYFAQIIDFEQKKADAGLFMSDFACDNIISQCEDFIANTEEHYLILTFNNKVDQVADLSVEERDAYKEKNQTLIKETVLPAYRTLATALTGLLGKGTNNKGLSYFEKGKEYYEYLVYYNTGCSLEIPDIQAMVEAQRTADLKNSAALVAANSGLWEKCSNVSLTERDSVATLNVLQNEMLRQFPAAPDTSFTVNYIDECMEKYMAPAFYITAPIDNYANNSIFINAATDTTTMRYFTTLAHEGFPGHLYQTVMSYEAGLSPARSILNFPGYVEGWATYVEMLSYQYAGLDENVASLLSMNQSALLSLYASTDLGIHYDGWSFDDTVAFWAGYGITDEDSLRDVYELIVEEPAHYLKYYVGYLEFLNLKKTAQETYGSSYSDVAFHQALLDIGPAPFDIVEKYLGEYYSTGN